MTVQFRILDSNYVFLADTQLSATSTNSNFPLSNLKKYFRSKVWRSAGYFKIISSNKKIDFKESSGGSQLTATLTEGSYSIAGLETEIETQLNAAGAAHYTVSYSAATGFWTIATDGAYLSLLFSSGTNTANSSGPPLGFSGDQTSALTYTGSIVAIHSEEGVVVDLAVTSPVDSFTMLFDPMTEIVLTDTALVYLQASATDVWDSPAVNLALTIDFNLKIATHFFTTTQNYRYWRVKIIDPHNPNLYVELPKLILSLATQLTQTPEIGFKNTLTDQSVKTSTPYGHQYWDVYPMKRGMEFNFAYLSETDLIVLENIFRTVGTSIPIAVALDALNDTFNVERLFIYGRIKGDHAQLQRFLNYFDTPLVIEECI